MIFSKFKRSLYALVVSVSCAAVANAAEPQVELLWPLGAPGATGEADSDKPRITAFLADPEIATGAAVVICPGGAYVHLAVGHEGVEIAEWLNAHGISAFMLEYRLGAHGYRHPIPLLDAQRAIRLVRANAEKWKIDPKRVGIMGFSAGGHLASTAATKFDSGKADAEDPIDRLSSRPDVLILGYPVISFHREFAHRGSRNHLLGSDAEDEELAKTLSNETQVTSETPPTFIVHSHEDSGVLVENSIAFYLALREAKVPVEMHLFQNGKHGFGLAKQDPSISTWADRCIDWLSLYDFAKKR